MKVNSSGKNFSDVKPDRLLHQLFEENPILNGIVNKFATAIEIKQEIKNWAMTVLKENQEALLYYQEEKQGIEQITNLRFKDFAAIRILDYIHHSGRQFKDDNFKGQIVENDIAQTASEQYTDQKDPEQKVKNFIIVLKIQSAGQSYD